jgi:hypothetical protein
MTLGESIRETIAMYSKHGWALRRVLLSVATAATLRDERADLFGAADVAESDIDAAWFSRTSTGSRVAWELRRLGGEPFALMEVVDDSAGADEIDDMIADVESRMRNRQ